MHFCLWTPQSDLEVNLPNLPLIPPYISRPKRPNPTVNQKILLDKLNHYGIRELALDFFTSYLKNRQQFVFANGVQSDKMQITCGVPQGSTLVPVLFLLYINDLPLSNNFFVIFLLMTRHYLFLIQILTIWRKKLILK